jgi:His-Xaa-Ser system radical SAM maturase HxsB
MTRFLGREAWLPKDRGYHLLPFKFHALSDAREVLVSETGDWLIAPRGSAERIAARAVSAEDPFFQDLLAGFFVSTEQSPELLDVMAARYRGRKGHLDSFTALHILVITLRCNFSCHYCQVSRQTQDRTQYDMSEIDIDAALNLVFRSPSPDLTIEFQGGEPLAAFDRVQYAVRGALTRNAQANRRLRFVICSNLSLLTDEMLAFCREHRIMLSTSLDGPAALHEANRPARSLGQLEWMADRLSRARAALGSEQVAALMTTSKASLSQPEAIVDAYRTLGFQRIFLRPIQPYGFAERLRQSWRYSVTEFLEFYKRALTYILSLNRDGVNFAEDYASLLLRRMHSPFPTGYVDLQSPTGMITSVAAYNYDGGVYASDESRMLAESGDFGFRLGHVRDGYDSLFYGAKAREMVTIGVNEALAGCADCGLQAYCGTDLIRNWRETGDLYGHRAVSSFCELNMGILTFLFELMDSDRDASAILRRWAA